MDIAAMIRAKLDRRTMEALGLPGTDYVQVTDPATDIKAAWDAVVGALPVLWYADSDTMVERGQVLRLPSHEVEIGEFFIIHTQDVPDVRARLRGYRLKHLREFEEGASHD